MYSTRILLSIVFALFASTVLAAKKDKVDICHFDLDYGVWKQISISGNAVGKHFNNHDDGLPDGQTLGTLTRLDDECEPVPPPTLACPCWDTHTTESLALYFENQPTSNPVCLFTLPYSAYVATHNPVEAQMHRIYALGGPDGPPECGFQRPQGNLSLNISQPEAATCMTEMVAVAAQITWCPQP